ncbi:hypothetical protein OS965_40325 [Streptomyces sp. H27-G5]|uniref:hypothetical protein n=1 Tax=Streptomyces sp. H27-G5 TaxID=2996698 RepID=UPI00226EE5E7|nr:hypothetical protein [Streptomyces sp. H27-G5]MCY0924277.1 hypothetical protein [Streptomyces sp. H27-G5]
MTVFTQPIAAHQPQTATPFATAGAFPVNPFAQPVAPPAFPVQTFPVAWQTATGMPAASQLPLLITDISLRCAAVALNTVIEQLRVEPQLLAQIQAQGQLPQHSWSSVLTECARRVAPGVHALFIEAAERHLAGSAAMPHGIAQTAPAMPFAPYGTAAAPAPAFAPFAYGHGAFTQQPPV